MTRDSRVSAELTQHCQPRSSSLADLAATIFWRFRIDAATEIHDPIGRPYKVSEGAPRTGLFV
jgi:hypothetical protein